MDISVFRSRFRPQRENEKSVGVPFGRMIEVWPDEADPGFFETSDIYSIETHDRGMAGQETLEYYQIVFRVTDKEGYSDGEDFKLLIADPINGERIDNQLIYDEENDLWYQKTIFDNKGRPTRDTAVDSITIAGNFRVNLIFHQGRKDEKIIQDIHILVMPSVISPDDYKIMLDDLLRVHERLVVKGSSAVGIGSYDKSRYNTIPGTPEYDLMLWERLKAEIKSIRNLPATLLQKTYKKMPQNKTRRFDNRVMSSYAASGGQWCEGAVYNDDHDIYENRIIKHVIRRMSTKLFAEESNEQILNDEDKESIIREELSRQFGSEALGRYDGMRAAPVNNDTAGQDNTPPVSTELSCGRRQSYRYQVASKTGNERKKSIYFERSPQGSYTIRTFKPDRESGKVSDYSYYPFTMLRDNVEYYCGVSFTTVDMHAAFSIIISLAALFDAIERAAASRNETSLRSLKLYVESTSRPLMQLKEDKYYLEQDNARMILIDNVTSCRFDGRIVNGGAEYDMYRDLISSSAFKYLKNPGKEISEKADIVRFIEAQKRKYGLRSGITKEVKEKRRKACGEIAALLDDPWFVSVDDSFGAALQQTPLFIYNKNYRAVYNILHEIQQYHPSLTGSFEDNLYGVYETHSIYEYWVFCELLDRFLNLGFKTDAKAADLRMGLEKQLAGYINKHKKPEGFMICMYRDVPKTLTDPGDVGSLEILLGFNCKIGEENARGRDKYLLPDYFICVKREEEFHWYFLDAKYEEYNTEEQRSQFASSLYQRAEGGHIKNSVPDVCYDKYIKKMEENAFIESFAESCAEKGFFGDRPGTHVIKGAYLIVAKYAQEIEEEITKKDRLCGKSYHNMIGEDENSVPKHRLGSIVLRPDKRDELTTLLEMIFEYKEGSETLDSESRKEAHLKCRTERRPFTLNVCWDSSSDHSGIDGHMTIESQLTQRGAYKYYISCNCGARRFESFCGDCYSEIIKHDRGNYHMVKDDWNRVSMNRWNFYCPNCGNAIVVNDQEGF